MFIIKDESSQRKTSLKLGLSRTTLRKAIKMDESIKLSTLKTVAEYYGQKIEVFAYPKNHTPDNTTVAVSFRINKDGPDSWKIHLMNMVDEFRKSKDIRLFILPPDNICTDRIKALIAASVIELCYEVKISPPKWAQNTAALNKPWFVSGMESLKASALLESPLGFRAKNIFVHENFLERA